jgi:hypothetical protein
MRAKHHKSGLGMKPRPLFTLAVVALSFFSGTSYSAGLSPSTRAEVNALLENLGASECRFFRNDTWYTGAAARDHLKKKYDYLAKKGLIAMPEDFIARAATKSSITGEPYKVQCPGYDPELSADWLTQELERLRKAQGQ